MKTLVDDAIQYAEGDTIGMEPDAFLRQCCGRVWTMIRDRLEAAGEKKAAELVQDWCEPEWVKVSMGKIPNPNPKSEKTT